MIVVVGSVNADFVLRCARLPKPGETVTGHSINVSTGGKGANQAVAAARLGSEVSLIGCVGQDAFGEQAVRALQQEGISVSHLAVRPGPTGVAMVTVESSGQNCIAVHAGANDLLSVADVDAAASLIARASMLVCQLESPLPSVLRAIDVAREAGVPVLLNPAPARPLPPGLFEQIDFLIPNESEATLLAGSAAAHQDGDVVNAASTLHALGARTVIVTRGAQGVCLVDENGVQHLPAHPVKALDTTGAGDAFVGAFAVARQRGEAVSQAIAFGQAVAAVSVTREGGMASLPRLNEVLGVPGSRVDPGR